MGWVLLSTHSAVSNLMSLFYSALTSYYTIQWAWHQVRVTHFCLSRSLHVNSRQVITGTEDVAIPFLLVTKSTLPNIWTEPRSTRASRLFMKAWSFLRLWCYSQRRRQIETRHIRQREFENKEIALMFSNKTVVPFLAAGRFVWQNLIALFFGGNRGRWTASVRSLKLNESFFFGSIWDSIGCLKPTWHIRPNC